MSGHKTYLALLVFAIFGASAYIPESCAQSKFAGFYSQMSAGYESNQLSNECLWLHRLT